MSLQPMMLSASNSGSLLQLSILSSRFVSDSDGNLSGPTGVGGASQDADEGTWSIGDRGE